MLLSLSRLRSSFLASCLSVFVGFLLEPCDGVTAVAREPAGVKLGLLYEVTIDTPGECLVPGRIVDSSESDSSPLHSSSMGLSGSLSGSSSKSFAIAASATGDFEYLDEWLRVYQSRPGLIGLPDTLGDDIVHSSTEPKGRRPICSGRAFDRIVTEMGGRIYMEMGKREGDPHLQQFAMKLSKFYRRTCTGGGVSCS